MSFLASPLKTLDKNLKKWRGNPRAVWGLPTGIETLDVQTGGLQNEDLIVIAARPNVGKSALMNQICFDNARVFKQTRPDDVVVLFTAEMPAWRVLLREVSRKSGVPALTIQSGMYTDREEEAIAEATEEIQSLPIILEDTSSASTDHVWKKLKDWQDKYQLEYGLVAYDYLQICADPGDTQYKRVSHAAREFKAIAKAYKVPLLLASQLKRKNPEEPDPWPLLSDLKDSGVIEEVSDVVCFIHRESYFSKGRKEKADDRSKAFLIYAKNRNGPTTQVDVLFDPAMTCFYEENP